MIDLLETDVYLCVCVCDELLLLLLANLKRFLIARFSPVLFRHQRTIFRVTPKTDSLICSHTLARWIDGWMAKHVAC